MHCFKRHLFAYIVVNIFLVGLYFSNYKQGETAGYWFIYPLFG
ncbi:MAG: 2TM domain-containing protein [Bacteroidetes bacterium]|nr:2TM domain-containing protein [Bacteroidota bacterium]